MRSGLRLALATTLAAATVGGIAAAAPSTTTVPDLAGRTRTGAEALIVQNHLLYKPPKPSSRYELPQGVKGIGDELTVVPEQDAPDRLVTGQTPRGGDTRPVGDRVDFSTMPRPPGHNRMPLQLELNRASLGSDGRSLLLGLAPGQFADSCLPLDHVNVAPRADYLLASPYVNVTDEVGPCAHRSRTVSLQLRRKASPKPVVERVPVKTRPGLFNVGPSRWDRVRRAIGGKFAVTYFTPPDSCFVFSHATVEPRGEDAALTVFVGTTSEHPNFCPLGRVRRLALVPIPDALVGRAIVDGAPQQ